MFATHGRPDQSINVLDRLDLRSDDTHPFHDTRLWSSSSIVSTVYNTVILGYGPFDALHLAAAESAGADVLLTTDDRLLKRTARKLGNPRIPVQNPLSWIKEQGL